MKPTELRIGNYVKLHNYKAHALDRKEFLVSKDFANIEDYKPVPLTEEWLLKFGFYKTELGFSFNLRDDNGIGENLLIDVEFNEAEIESYNYRFGSSGDYPTIFVSTIEYVHSLQNLYFALTGQELTIK